MLRARAKELRINSTDAEQHLWVRLRRRQLDGCRFRRQAPIGPFIVDFVCLERHLIVELDGGQHADQQTSDARRTRFLEIEGYHLIRFWNHEVLRDTDAVVERILATLRGVG
jgi:very-short-patch-repair endonuclease